MVVDAAGRQVELPEQARRVVTTFKPATLFVLSLRQPQSLVGIDTPSRHDPLVRCAAPELTKLPGVGSKSQGINLETVLGLQPDLVILYAHKEGVKLADRLQRSGIPAVVIKPERFDSINDTLKILGKALGQTRQAKQAIQAIQNVQGMMQDRLRDLEQQKRKRVYYAAPHGVLTTAPADLLQDELIQMAGGINVSGHLRGYFKQISAEQLIQWSPEAIAVCRMIRPQARSIFSRKQFALLPAVQEDNLHVFPSSLTPWDFPSPLSVLGALWLGNRLYPELFADFSLIQEVDAFHQILFGKSLTEMSGELDDLFYDSDLYQSRSFPENFSTKSR